VKKLTITYSLEYNPFKEHTHSGNCQMKCPCGDCILEVVLEGALKNITQSVTAIKGE